MESVAVRDETVASAPAAPAESAFSKSIAISAARCLLTYVVLPLLAPVVDLTSGVGPAFGIALSVVSIVAIVASMRRFWVSSHRLKWPYTVVGGGILVLLVAQSVIDARTLAG